MGGKHKQAQRTKDNVKPSSSGRSAALLANATAPVPNFATVKDCGYVPIFPCLPNSPSEEFDAGIDSNFQLVLKKMNKKDSTTRLKALQEFAGLVGSSELDAVKAVLPFWPRLYCLLAADVEHRVREAAQEAHRTMVVRTKRNMAPYLRLLAGPWFAAQFDTYPPVGTAAARAFQDAFPANKLVEAVMFCRDEILKYISDNLLGHVPQSTNSAKNVSAEKLKARQQRIVVSCLQAFAHFLRMVPAEQLPTVATLPAVENLVGSKRFWELASDQIPLVRSAWMCVVTAVLQCAPQLMERWRPQVVGAVLARLDDAEPSVLPYVWEAALHVFSTIKDWEGHGNLDRQVLPPLWQILKEAGHGSASAIFPNLLPVLSCLMRSCKIPANKEALCNQFFSSLREGFTKKSVAQSRAESEAVAQCYIECIRYISSSNECSPQQLVDYHLLPAVELVLTNAELTLLSKMVFEHISSLVQYWSQHRTDPSFATMLESFWDGLAIICTKSLKLCGISSTPQQVELCLSLRSSGKLRKKVHFGRKADDPKKVLPPDEGFKRELEELVYLVCGLYLTELRDNRLSAFVVPLSRLVTAFNTPELFARVNPGQHLSETLAFINQSWPSYSDANKQAALELVFCWVHHLQPAERVPTLWSLTMEEDMMLWTIRVARSHHSEAHVAEWLRSPRLGEYLLSLTCQLSSPNYKHARKVLGECISATEDGDLLVGGRSVAAVLEVLSSLVRDHADLAQFAAQLVVAVCGSLRCAQVKLSLGRLITALFVVCCLPSSDSDMEASGVSHSALTSAWQAGLSTLVALGDQEHMSNMLKEFSSTVRQHLTATKVLSDKEMEHLVKMAGEAVATVATDEHSTSSLAAAFLLGLEPELTGWETQLASLCLDAEKMAGHSGLEPLATEKRHHHDNDYSVIQLPQYINFSLFIVAFITETVFVSSEPLDPPPKFTNLNPDGKIIKSDVKDHLDTEVVEVTVAGVPSPAVPDSPQSTSRVTDEVSSPETSEASKAPDTPSDVQSDEEELPVTETFEEKEPVPQERSHTELDDETVKNLQEGLLHAACCVAFCKVFRKHYRSTSQFSIIDSHMSSIQKQFEDIISQLQAAGVTSPLEETATQRARDRGGLWVLVRYLVSGPGQFTTAYTALKECGRCEYGAQVLASLTDTTLSPSQLDDRPHLFTLATWLRHKGTPSDVLGGLIVGSLEAWPQLDNQQLLRDCDVSTREPREVDKVSEMIHSVAGCVRECPQLLTAHLWDFVLVSTPYYVLSLANCQPTLVPDTLLAGSLRRVHNIATFSVASCELFCSLAAHVHRASNDQDPAFLEHAREWNDVFSGDVHQAVLALFVRVSEFVKQQRPSLIGHRVLQALSHAAISLDTEHLTSKSEMVKQPVTHHDVLRAACELINCSVQPLQVAAYHLLKKSLPLLVEADASLVSSLESEGAEEQDPQEPMVRVSDLKMEPLLTRLLDTQAVVDALLADFQFGDTCLVQPHTDSHHYATAYLLLWDLLLHACGLASSELRYHYASIIKSNGSLESLLHHLFFLMPEEVLETTPSRVMTHLFQAPPSTMPGDVCSSQELQHWACWVYYCVLRRLPAMVRQWWADTKPKVNTVVQRVTFHYVSPLLCQSELQVIQTNNSKLKNMEVKVLMKAREVVASYAVDDTRMELVIALPEVYPLGMVQVSSNAPLVGTNQWRNWVRHLSIFLTHQNGSVWDGLLLWKSNLDKRFEGVEECYICFSILHGTNFQIPKLCCKTCKKKFHSPCLYKWFSTSNKSTCPICRNMF